VAAVHVLQAVAPSPQAVQTGAAGVVRSRKYPTLQAVVTAEVQAVLVVKDVLQIVAEVEVAKQLAVTILLQATQVGVVA